MLITWHELHGSHVGLSEANKLIIALSIEGKPFFSQHLMDRVIRFILDITIITLSALSILI